MHDHKPVSTDPVCGMHVTADSVIAVEYRGETYRFCDQACADTFSEDPERWVAHPDDPGFVHEHHN